MPAVRRIVFLQNLPKLLLGRGVRPLDVVLPNALYEGDEATALGDQSGDPPMAFPKPLLRLGKALAQRLGLGLERLGLANALGRSRDAVHWSFEPEKIHFVDENGQPFDPIYAYDPRLVKVEDTYYIMWCQDFYGAAIGMAKTKDFKTFTRVENPFLPFNRNAVLFPRKIGGNFVMLSRPSDSGHTPFGDIFLSESPDLKYWGKHRHVMSRSSNWWEGLKIGGGAAPIETSEGWLLFYHGVCQTCNGYVYSIGGAILDIDEPSKVKYRCANWLLTPEKWYEERGFVDNVTFPCATLHDPATGRIAVYYGCADTYVSLAFGYVDEIIDYIKANNRTTWDDTDLGRR